MTIFRLIFTDPFVTRRLLEISTAVLPGAFTFMVATIGINIVANFVSPAFDFSNVAPSRISWRTGGMIAAIGSVFITPWNIYNNPEVIHYTLDILGSFIGPLFGILICDFYLVQKQKIHVPDLYTMSPTGRYWYQSGYNRLAVVTMIPAAIVPILCVVVPGLGGLANFTWFIGMGIAFVLYSTLNRQRSAPAGPGSVGPVP